MINLASYIFSLKTPEPFWTWAPDKYFLNPIEYKWLSAYYLPLNDQDHIFSSHITNFLILLVHFIQGLNFPV